MVLLFFFFFQKAVITISKVFGAGEIQYVQEVSL